MWGSHRTALRSARDLPGERVTLFDVAKIMAFPTHTLLDLGRPDIVISARGHGCNLYASFAAMCRATSWEVSTEHTEAGGG